MPTSKNISKYPEKMLDIIEQVCETKKECTIAYPTTKQAKSERLRFYGLIRAIVVNQHSLAEEASKLTITLFGQDRKNPNVITIAYPTLNDDFYGAVAEKHRIAAESELVVMKPVNGDNVQ